MAVCLFVFQHISQTEFSLPYSTDININNPRHVKNLSQDWTTFILVN